MASKSGPVKPATKDPSLKKYFKYMVNSRKLTIQFSQGKIKEIIETDLQINFSSFSDLLKDVSTEAFAFYIQGWPGWQPKNFQNCIDNTEEAYILFKDYLKLKILGLQEKEKEYLKDEAINGTDEVEQEFTLTPPADTYQQFAAEYSNFKMKLPYTIQITGKPSYLAGLSVVHWRDKTFLKLQPPQGLRSHLTSNQVLNHPFVTIHFKVPNLIKFVRRNLHRIEMFLCKPTDSWTFPKQDRILDIRKFSTRTNIYTLKFMQELFNMLLKVVKTYNRHFPPDFSKEISNACTQFLNDISEANLNFSTIQECTDICYSIGDATYFCDSASDKNAEVNLRKIYSPQILFTLLYCSILQADVRPNGTLAFFDFHNPHYEPSDELSPQEDEFIKGMKDCLSYGCSLCSSYFKRINDLQVHLLTIHPYPEVVICSRCRQENSLYDLLDKRWRHNCSKPLDLS